MLHRNPALRTQLFAGILFSFLWVFVLPEPSFCVTDRHTIVIDGVNDFYSDEKYETTTSASGYFAYLTWDTDNLYLGCEGFYVGDPGGQRFVVWYLDTEEGDGAMTALPMGTQLPALPEGFLPDFYIVWNCDNTQLNVLRSEGGSWDSWPAPTEHFLSGNYMEMSIPWEWLYTPDILKVVSSHIKEDMPEWTYAGLPADTFVDGYDPDFSTFLTAFSGMGTGDLHVGVVPDTLDAPWQINGPNSYFHEGSGTTYLTYLEPGEYSVTWGEVAGWETPPPEIATLDAGEIVTFQGVYEEINGATILGIEDVPDDQGGQVRISWSKSRFDAQGEVVVTGYEIYRREPSLKIAGWDFVTLVPAHWDSVYQTLAPTLCDSSITGGLCWSTFMIRAATESPGVFFDSHPDSGYSVDNLAPAAPTGLIVADEVLSWDEPTDADFGYFSVYGSSSPELGPDAILVGYTTEQSMSISGVSHAYLLVTATDFAGNEGPPAYAHHVSGLQGVPVIIHALNDNVPNPFNPQTTIAFELPQREAVTLRVFDIAGRLVRNLITAEPRTPGRHEAVWNGRDDTGRQLASGTYFYRLEAGSFSETKRMVLVK